MRRRKYRACVKRGTVFRDQLPYHDLWIGGPGGKMEHDQSELAASATSNVIQFKPAAGTATSLSLRDRMDVATWRDPARTAGFDRIIIHERASGDPPEFGSFLGIYRHGEAWARWNVARCGAGVLAWCSRSGADIGRFATVADALDALLGHRPSFPGSAGDQVRRPATLPRDSAEA